MSEEKPPAKAPRSRVSEQFNAEDADLTFKSSDNVLFHIHRKNLEAHAAGFAPAGFGATLDEVVSLSESAAVLDILFQFVYPVRQPDLEKMSIEVLAPLAEAVEKYEIFSAMSICKVHMGLRATVPGCALEVMAYATKHGHGDIASNCAELLLDVPLETMLSKIPGNMIAAWVLYYDSWNEILRSSHRQNIVGVARATATTYHNGTSNVTQPFMLCYSCDLRIEPMVCAILSKLSDRAALKNLKKIFALDNICPHMRPLFKAWHDEIETAIRNLKPFHKYF